MNPTTPEAPLTEAAEHLSDKELTDELTPTRYAMERGLLVRGDHTELVLVRHAQQVRTLNEARQPGGPGISDLGRAQARMTGGYLSTADSDLPPFAAAYFSDLNRSKETARIISSIAAPHVDPIPDPELREVDMYSRDVGGTITSEMQISAGEDFRRTLQWDSFPNTESSQEFRERIFSAMDRIASEHTNQRVLVVTHAGAIATFLASVIGATTDMFYFAGHTSVNRVHHGDGRFVAQTMNEVGHLRLRGVLTY